MPGLDHHCVWLNTCVGKWNYTHFLCLAVIQCVTQCLRFFVCVNELILKADGDRSGICDEEACSKAVWVFQVVAATILLGGYTSLVGFHSYLLKEGIGTYDW